MICQTHRCVAAEPDLVPEQLAPETVLSIASHIVLEDGAFVIGGQALNLWAELYSDLEELKLYRPYTSKDIDYYGLQDAAEKLAAALGGKVLIPEIDNQTPQTAIVEALVEGKELKIDFLGHVLGVRPDHLNDFVAEIIVPYTQNGETKHLAIPVMHPLHCLQSRISNLAVLHREDDTAKRQAEAAPLVLREYINRALEDGDVKEAIKTLQRLFDFLSKDITGKQSHRHINRDPIEVIQAFVDDERLDERFRIITLKNMIQKIERQRSALGRIWEVLSLQKLRKGERLYGKS